MRRNYGRAPRALRDLAEIYSYLLQERPDAAQRFRGAADKAMGVAGDNPLAGRLCEFEGPELDGVRRLTLPPPFQRYLILYRPEGKGALILRVLHAALDYERAFDDEDELGSPD